MAITDALCRSFLDLWWHFDPAAATQAGAPGYEGRLGAFDPDSMRAHLAAFRSIAGAVEELEVDDTADEIDRTALLDRLRVLLFRFEREHPWERNPALWLEHAAAAFEGLLGGLGNDSGAEAALERLRALPGFLGSLRETLRKPPLFLVETALAQLPALSAVLDEAGEHFEPAWSAAGGEAAAAMTEAKAALDQLESALRRLAADPDPYGAAIGEDEVDLLLHHEHASIHNAAEVWRAALRLAAEVENEVTALAAVIDAGRSWREVYDWQREESPVWSELSANVLEDLEGATRFAESQGLSTRAPPLDVVPLSAATQVLEPLARYRPAGAFSRPALQLGDPDRPAIPWLVVRLGVPGMHLHRSQRELLPALVRRHIAAPSTPLGWSIYAADLLAELGYRSDPEARLVQRVLFFRDVQLAIVDLGLHTKQFTAEEAVAHLLGRLPCDRRSALADVRRLACRPISACAAILGWQELRRLRDDVKAARGEEFSLEQFHRELFGYGGLPVPLIRWGMGLDA
ncbi:MAG TPA: DUF885 family protein [Gemmatimonadales bacterium]|nr:DUF885 family protein [Gemmatimonadales bacterium]